MKKSFGGELLKNKRKSKRPLDFKKTTHLVVRLKPFLPSLLSPRDKNLRKGFEKIAAKYNIKVYQLVFNHCHLHAAILFPNRESYVRFIKELTSKLVRYFSMSTKIKLRKIFLHRPFTRIVEWGEGIRKLNNYLIKNEKESGFKQIKLSIDRMKAKLDSGQLELFEFS